MADVRLGGIYADFTARNTRFVRAARQNVAALKRQQRAVTDLRRRIRTFNRTAVGMVRQLVSVRGAVTLLAGGGGLGLLIKRQTEYGASLIETSKRTGVAVRDLQLLQRAFEGDGASAQQTTKALETLNRRISEAGSGLQTYVRAFEDLGIAVDDLPTGVSTEFITQLAASFEGVTDQATRARIAQDLFGRSGQVLLTVLQRGDEEFGKLIASFESLGLNTQRELQNLKDLDQVFTDIGNTIQVGLASSVASASVEIASLAQLLTQRLPDAFDAVIRSVVLLIRHVDAVVHAFSVLFGVFVLRRLNLIAGGITALVASFGLLRGAVFAVVAVARVLLRAFTLFAVVEGLIQLYKFFVNLRGEIRLLGTTFSDVALVASTDFVETLVRGFVGLPGLLLGIVAAAGQLIIEAFAVAGGLAWEALRAAFTGADVGQALAARFEQAMATARDNISAQFSTWQIDTSAIDGLSDAIAGAVGRTRDEIEAARASLRSSARATVSDFAATFRPAVLPPVADLQAPSPLQLPAGVPLPEEGAAAGFGGGGGSAIRSQNTALQQQLDIAQRIGVAAQKQIDAIRRRTELLGKEADARVLISFRREQENQIAKEGLRLQQVEAAAIKAAAVASVNLRRAVASGNQTAAIAAALARSEALRVVEVAKKGTAAWEDQKKILLELVATFEGPIQNALTELQRRQAEVARFQELRNSIPALRAAFHEFGNSVLTNFNNIADAARSLARTIFNELQQALIVRPLVNAGVDFVTGLVQGAIGGAEHGGVHRGLTVVGERGPEIVDFERPARVYTNETLRNVASGGGSSEQSAGRLVVNYAPVIESDNEAAVERGLARAFPQFRSLVQNAIFTDLGRPSAGRAMLRRR